MALLEDFPTDPFTPSLRYAASRQLPITIPWTNKLIRMGASLSLAGEGNATFREATPFSEASLNKSKMAFRPGSRGSVRQASTRYNERSSEHLDVSMQGEIGFPGLSASGRAHYETNASEVNSHKAIKASLRAEYRSGYVVFADIPSFSAEATNILRAEPSPIEAFRTKYGDYYVGAYAIGGANGNLVTGAAATSSESKNLSVEYSVKVLWMEKSRTIEDHERRSTAAGYASLIAYDSLEEWKGDLHGSDFDSYANIMRASEENQRRSLALAQRVTERTERLGLKMGHEVPWNTCDAIFEAGLVVEILLLPFSALRDYTTALISGI
ncbi:hypothetical protein EJ04DRAFT_519904 [Polyplosphaeria fusca]|uniref:MACPF domain-containing protein n=1 Tax=Polyplosphaeria fusca TaxID=682080 RepID=A0A9P4V800_9PLEO|nr:hypothetical protein EJ04DRAFT_519904 [Polyplosphaeria fusca]